MALRSGGAIGLLGSNRASSTFLSEQVAVPRRCRCGGPSIAVVAMQASMVEHTDNEQSSSQQPKQQQQQKKKVYTRTKKPFTPKTPTTPIPKLDKFGRLRTPRAARELALSVLYSAFVSNVHPLKLFEERVKQRASFDKAHLESYEHRADTGENLVVEDEATASALEQALEAESSLEAMVLTAPPPLVYNSFAIRMARGLVKESAERWLQQEAILMEIIPAKWKAQPRGALLQICILQMALAEIETTETPPGVVVNETVELSKRFCDLAAPRIINGCLGSYIRRRQIKNRSSQPPISKIDRSLADEPLLPEDLGFGDEYTD